MVDDHDGGYQCDYDLGYQDGLEQAKYVSDYEVTAFTIEANYDDKRINVRYEDDDLELVVITKTALENMILTAQLGEYQYVFER